MAKSAHWISDPSATSIAFGPFRLFPIQRLLTENGEPVRIGSRAFDILLTLLERPGELVTKEELIARVWPNTFVEAANLAVQIAGLRRALGDGVGQTRYVINIPGRGYRFVAPVTAETEFSSDGQVAALERAPELPVRSSRATASAEGLNELTQKLQQQGVLTVARQGGSKAAVALAVVEKLLGGDSSGLWLLDLRPLGDS
jgi:DNA-binding winged helix-turn-helix (wHTH) protein